MSRQFLDLLRCTLQAIEPGYFHLRTTYSPKGIVRERVFCYELYHQLKIRLPHNNGLILHGEIDKGGHLDFLREHRRNPDFVLHVPGEHEGNTVVAEVKGKLNCRLDSIIKDFETLLTFTESYGYSAGVFVLYNHTIEQLTSRLGARLLELQRRPTAPYVYVQAVATPGGECQERILADMHP